MNYKRLYQQIIEHRQSNPVDGYTERHHIIPRSLGGTDDASNLVDLAAREHFICHYLLAKMYPADSNEWHKMNHAFMMMRSASGNQDRYFNSRLYESAKQNFRKVMSRAQSGTQNSQHGKMWINKVGTLENRKIPRTDPVPDGWRKGRRLVETKDPLPKKIKQHKHICKRCKSKYKPKLKESFCSQKCKTYYRSPYYEFIDNNIDDMIEYFQNCKSIAKTLDYFGFEYSTRKGNSYFSSLLKQRGISVLTRRNSPD